MPAAVLIALVVLTALAPPAGATFPGRNGDLLLTERNRTHGFQDSSRLMRIDPSSSAVTRTDICAQSELSNFPGPLCADVGPPSASPDGRWVAFATRDVAAGPPYHEPFQSSIRVLPLTTGERRHVPLPGRTFPYESIVRWTPDLGFALAVDQRRVLLAGPDGANRGTLAAPAVAPDVSSDGRLAFVRRGHVYVKKPGGKPRRLTGGDRPSWSPRGRLIAFSRRAFVYAVPARGGRPRRLTRGFNPVWSPDGRQIAFFRSVKDPGYPGQDPTYLFALDRDTNRVRRVSRELLAVSDGFQPNGLDWQAAR